MAFTLRPLTWVRDIELSAVTERQLEKLWGWIDTSPGQGPEGECHIWCGGKSWNGYGRYNIGSARSGSLRNVRTHRLIWKLAHPDEPLLSDIFICHRCDNPPCCNVLHLFPGTQQQNSADMVCKGRAAKGDAHGSRIHPERLVRGERHWSSVHPEKRLRGSDNGRAQMNEHDVVCIRSDVEMTHTECAEYYGVWPTLIHRIRSGETWAHVGGILPLSVYRRSDKRS